MSTSEHYQGYSNLVTYLQSRRIWSYHEFLTLHQDVITTSPPFTEWNACDSTWSRRFLGAAKDLSTDTDTYKALKEKVSSERANECMRVYWEEVIENRKKNSVKRTFRVKALDIYEVVGNGMGEEIIDDLQTSSKRLRRGKPETKSCVQSDGFNENFDEENGNDEINEDIEENHGNTIGSKAGNDDDQDEEDNVSLELRNNYMRMRNDRKWKLPSGKYIEDVFYEYAKKLSYESPVHSFIIDTSNATVMDLFNDEDREQIMTHNILPEPQLQDELIDHIIRYRKSRPEELREVVHAGFNISPYDTREHFDYYYVHQVFSQLLMRYELRSEDFTSCHLEGWFQTNIWSIIIDTCFIDLKTIEFVRGEGCSLASGQRKNDGRESADIKKLCGHKCDGIAREMGSFEEYAVSEEGRFWTGKDDTKCLADGLKLFKLMRDMLHQKIRKYGLDLVRSRQLEIVGFLHSAFNLQTLVLDTPSGYMCRLRKLPITKVPANLTEVDELIFMVHGVLLAKLRIRRCLEHLSNINVDSKEDLKERLKKGKRSSNDNHDFPVTHRTPKKNRIKNI